MSFLDTLANIGKGLLNNATQGLAGVSAFPGVGSSGLLNQQYTTATNPYIYQQPQYPYPQQQNQPVTFGSILSGVNNTLNNGIGVNTGLTGVTWLGIAGVLVGIYFIFRSSKK